MPRFRRHGLRRPAAAVALSLAVVACGQTGEPADEPAAEPAEPGQAPSSAEQVPGRLIEIDGEPEGIVVTSTGVVAVALRGPDRLALVDLDTERVTEVPTSSAARHLTLASPSGPVVAPLEASDEVVLVDPSTGDVVGQFSGIEDGPHDAAVHPSGLISVTDELGGGLYVLDPRSNDVRRIDSSPQPGGVASVGDLPCLADVEDAHAATGDVDRDRQVADRGHAARLR